MEQDNNLSSHARLDLRDLIRLALTAKSSAETLAEGVAESDVLELEGNLVFGRLGEGSSIININSSNASIVVVSFVTILTLALGISGGCSQLVLGSWLPVINRRHRRRHSVDGRGGRPELARNIHTMDKNK